VETPDDGERLARHGGWAGIGNLRVSEPYRRQGVATWLLGHAADWPQLAQVERLLDYAWLEGRDPMGCDYADYRAFLPASGFRELTRNKLLWTRQFTNLDHSPKDTAEHVS
jgi:GNAT superfamily N-acetyltransferase